LCRRVPFLTLAALLAPPKAKREEGDEPMTYEEVERGLKVLQDNMTVQGVMKNRLENNLDRLEVVVAENSAAIARNTEAIAKLADGMMVMQAAMKSLFEHIDRFIRGLETDGHRSRGEDN
jgi:hypothetical protein